MPDGTERHNMVESKPAYKIEIHVDSNSNFPVDISPADQYHCDFYSLRIRKRHVWHLVLRKIQIADHCAGQQRCPAIILFGPFDTKFSFWNWLYLILGLICEIHYLVRCSTFGDINFQIRLNLNHEGLSKSQATSLPNCKDLIPDNHHVRVLLLRDGDSPVHRVFVNQLLKRSYLFICGHNVSNSECFTGILGHRHQKNEFGYWF